MKFKGELGVLGRFQRALLSDLKPKQILRNLLEVATEEGVERAALFLYHPETRELMGEVASGRGRHHTVSAIALPLYARGPVQEAFFAEGPVRLGEEWLLPVVGEKGVRCWADPERRCTERPRATRQSRFLLCPSCPRFAAKGVLSLEGVPPSLKPLLPLLAQLTALALKNGELLQERDEALARLARNAEALAHVGELAREVAKPLEPDEVLWVLARVLHERFGFYRVTVALVREGVLLGHLTLRGEEAFWTQEVSRIRFPLGASSDPLAQAAREGRTLLVPREALPEVVAQGMGASVAMVAILAEGEVLGVLAVDHGPGGRPVSEEEVRYAELLAGVAGVALRNAHLYREKTQLSSALAAERARLSALLEELPDGVVILEGEKGVANARAREILGSGPEIQAKALPPSLAPALEGGRVEVVLGGRAYSVRGKPLGEVRLLVLHEITERIRMERALKEQATFTQALLDLAERALAEEGLRAMARGVVERLRRLFAAEEGALVAEVGGEGRLLYHTFPWEGTMPRPNLLEVALEEEKPRVARAGEGTCALVEGLGLAQAVAVPFKGEAFRGGFLLAYRTPKALGERILRRMGQVGSLVALILEKALLLERLEAEEARLFALLEHAQDLVYILDREGRIRFASPNVPTLLGYGREAPKEEARAWDFLHPEDRPQAQALLQELLASPGEVRTAQFRVLHRDGTPIPMEAWGRNLLHDPRVQGVVVALRDLRPRLEADHLKSEFIAAVSHELRTPLAVIMGLAELLQEEPLPPSAQESVELIRESAFRLKTMVDNLLDTSRLEAGRFEVSKRPVDLRPLLLDLARSFQGVARLSGVDFRVEVEELPLLEADPDRMAQVVGNLLNNAFKFTPPGGKVSLRARVQGEAVVLKVEDTGPGIPKEELPKLFQRYARAKNASARGVSGTGLGLFISKHIVEAHGGRIEVETEEGRGSLFRVILPLDGAHPGGGG
ncbi:sensor histidine kinase [Thermus composti]|uniref:histidine kinase n=1 Tax=Thermus composti TaxID=532059 RepID=A0ABV6PYV3_9DEIN|nr:ATP-binding protein [Thermus composti]GGM93614.1 sensor histidine kinase [Thermus composti]